MILIFLSSCNITSEFQLASESKLPVWFKMPQNRSRSDYYVRIVFRDYIPFYPKVGFYIYEQGRPEKLVSTKTGSFRWHPETIKKGSNHYPQYMIIRVDGVDEIYVHPKRDNILYVFDNP